MSSENLAYDDYFDSVRLDLARNEAGTSNEPIRKLHDAELIASLARTAEEHASEIRELKDQVQYLRNAENARGFRELVDNLGERPSPRSKKPLSNPVLQLETARHKALERVAEELWPCAHEASVTNLAYARLLQVELTDTEKQVVLNLLLRGISDEMPTSMANELVSHIENEKEGGFLCGCLFAIRNWPPVSGSLRERVAESVRQRLLDACPLENLKTRLRQNVVVLSILTLGDCGAPEDAKLFSDLLEADKDSTFLGQITPALWWTFLRDPESFPEDVANALREEVTDRLSQFSKPLVIRDARYFSRCSKLLRILCFRQDPTDLASAMIQVTGSEESALACEMLSHIKEAKAALTSRDHVAWLKEREDYVASVIDQLRALADASSVPT